MAKKKLALKSVSRGFATTSIPKKQAAVVEPEEPPAAEQTENETAPNQPPSDDGEPSPEQQYIDKLQSYVDKLSPKVEREVSRIMSAFEYERRISRTYTSFTIPAKLQGDIISFAANQARVKFELNKCKPSRQWSPLDSSEKEENKLLLKLAITHNVLQRLSFSDERVSQCLNEIPSPSLDDAMTWMCLNCPNDEFWSAINTTKPYIAPIFVAPSATPTKQSTPGRFSLPSSPLRNDPKPRSESFEKKSEEDHAELKAKILALSMTQATNEDEDREDSTLAHVRLSLAVHKLTGPSKKSRKTNIDKETEDKRMQEIQQLRTEIDSLKNEFDFDPQRASSEFKTQLKHLHSAALLQKLEDSVNISEPDRIADQAHCGKSSESPKFDTVDDYIGLEGLFENDGPIDSTDAPRIGVTILDLDIPSSYSGRLPAFVLSEITNKLDKYATITFNSLSKSSFSHRMGVTLKFSDNESPPIIIQMIDVSARSEIVAKNYLSTIVLHKLWISNKSRNIFQPRSLALGFRELWNELEEQEFKQSQAQLRGRWDSLLQIYHGKPKVINAPISASATNDGLDLAHDIVRIPKGRLECDQALSDSFAERMMWPSYQNMLLMRNKLPIANFRQDIVNSLERNQVLVLSGETGCGKSTQLPSFLLEHELLSGKSCNILVTEPRRISAISLAQRVSQELGERPDSVGKPGSLIGYSIRLESKVCQSTRLTFATNGIALRMLESNKDDESGFSSLTHIILDEVHERNLESDFLLIVLKEMILFRPDLKVVLMSATIESDKLSTYFGGCPILTVPGRTFPVDVQYLEDAIEQTGWNIDEKSSLAKKADRNGALKYTNDPDAFAWYENDGANEANTDDEDADDQTAVTSQSLPTKIYDPATVMTLNMLDEKQIPYPLIIKLLELICFTPDYHHYSKAILIFLSGLAEIRKVHDLLQEHPQFGSPLFRLYPLHSSISNEQQSRVFDVPPSGIRKIVISTNIAETGITIPDCTAVIDAGRHREMRFDEKRQISRLVETYIAKSNAAQRRGRAGRVQDGICFHLFTKARHDTRLAVHPIPEIMRLSLQDLALRIKILKIKLGSSIEDTLSRALDPPAPINIQRAVASLVEAHALDFSENITPLGQILSRLPTDVGLGKFLLLAVVFKCVDPALTIAACLNSKSPFVTPFGQEAEANRKKLSFRTGDSDFLTIHNAYSSWRRCAPGFARTFCNKNFLSHQILTQIEELRSQLYMYLKDTNLIETSSGMDEKHLNKRRTFAVQVPEEFNVNSDDPHVINAVLSAGLYPKLLHLEPETQALKTIGKSNSAAFVHPSSVLHRIDLTKSSPTAYWNYFSLLHSKKLYAHEVGPVSPLSLLLLCGELDPHFGSDFLSIGSDKRLRFFADPKLSVTMNIMRRELTAYISSLIKGKKVLEERQEYFEFGVRILRCGYGLESSMSAPG